MQERHVVTKDHKQKLVIIYICLIAWVSFKLIAPAKEVMFSSLFVCLSVCLSATLRKKIWTDLHEIIREGWQWANEQTIRFWWRSGPYTDPYSDTGKTCLGGGMHCPSASSFNYCNHSWLQYLGNYSIIASARMWYPISRHWCQKLDRKSNFAFLYVM